MLVKVTVEVGVPDGTSNAENWAAQLILARLGPDYSRIGRISGRIVPGTYSRNPIKDAKNGEMDG